MEGDQALAVGMTVTGGMLSRFAAVIDQLAARCAALDAEAGALRDELRRLQEVAHDNADAKQIALERLQQARSAAQRRKLGRDDDESSPYVRPYAVTKGRTIPRRNVAVEALVSSAGIPQRDSSLMTPEYHDISVLCRQARSVAEISSMLGIPLTMARILVADMAAEKLIHVYQPPSCQDDLDEELLEKVLSGLRKL